eukprot:2943816-Karenia_brevis.AAC.1
MSCWPRWTFLQRGIFFGRFYHKQWLPNARFLESHLDITTKHVIRSTFVQIAEEAQAHYNFGLRSNYCTPLGLFGIFVLLCSHRAMKRTQSCLILRILICLTDLSFTPDETTTLRYALSPNTLRHYHPPHICMLISVHIFCAEYVDTNT